MRGKIQIELQGSFGNDQKIVQSAYTSNLENLPEDAHQTINNLIETGNPIPFESVVFRFWLRTPIFVDRKINTNAVSENYRAMPDDYFTFPADCQEIVNKAALPEIFEEYTESIEQSYNSYMASLHALKESERTGKITNIEFRRVREILRGQLPVSGMTERTMIMNLREFANFYRIRSKPDAQPEIQHVAKEMLRLVKESNMCPIAIEALEKNSWVI